MKRIIYTITFLFLSLLAISQVQNKQDFLFFKQNKGLSIKSKSNNEIRREISLIQITKTIDVPAAGTLSGLLTATEKMSTTDLTITGHIDARDFALMRDSMPVLSVLDLSGVMIDAYTGSAGTTSSSYPANEIPDYAFYFPTNKIEVVNSSLTSIILPTSATSIGNFAFTLCKSLSSVSISSTVTQIGYVAFVGCGANINVDAANPTYSSRDGVLFNKLMTTLIQFPAIPGDYIVPSTVDTINTYAFCFSDKVSSVSIPSTVRSIGAYAFTDCSGMINIDESNSYYSSQDGVLFDKSKIKLIQCPTSKTGNYIIPPSVIFLGPNSFYNCKALTSISIPSSVASIADGTFYNCTGLTSITLNSEPVDLNSSNTFYGVDKNTCVLNVPYGTKSDYQSASGWSSFANIVENPHGLVLEKNKVTLLWNDGNNTEVIVSSNETWTVSSNQSWLKVSPENGSGIDTISLTVDANTSIDEREGLITVSATGVDPQIITVVQLGVPTTFNISAGGLAASLTTDQLNNIMNLKLTGTIDDRDFKIMRDNMPKLSFLDLSEVTIAAYEGDDGTYPYYTSYPANSIPTYAFYNYFSSQNSVLISVILPTNITSIDLNAFNSCENITSISIPNSVTSIGWNAFTNCSALTSVTIPNSVTSIGSAAFSNCTSLKSISIPNSITQISENMFNNCSRLESVTLPSTIEDIDLDAFYGCSALKNITLPTNLKSIGGSAFANCISLTSFVVPETVTNLGMFIFSGDSSLIIVSLPKTLSYILSGTFYDCKNLSSISIPNTVTYIGGSAFWGCAQLKSITLPGSLTEIDNYAFNACTGLTTIDIPASVTRVGNGTFASCSALSSINVNNDNLNYASIDGVLFDKSKEDLLICPNGRTGSYFIPVTTTSIHTQSFMGCNSLTSITIPNSVTSIGDNAFIDCSGLTSIHALSVVPIDLSNNWAMVFDHYQGFTCTLYVPIGSSQAYRNAKWWQDFQNIVEESTGIQMLPASELGLSLNGNKLVIKNLVVGDLVQVYTTNGKLLFSEIANDQSLEINMFTKNVYIIRVGAKSSKIIVQ